MAKTRRLSWSAALVLTVLAASAGAGKAPPAAGHAAGPSLPSVDYPSLIAARDSVETLIRHNVDLSMPTYHLTVAPVRFKYWYAKGSADGWAFHITVGDTLGCPNNLVENALVAAGWEPKYDYAADGPDGTVMAMQTLHYLCVIEGQWDGGDDSDPSYVPEPGCDVIVTCVPRREGDSVPP
jgi:hypothetical protein